MIYELIFLVKVIQKEVFNPAQVWNLAYIDRRKITRSIYNDPIHNTPEHFTTTFNIAFLALLSLVSSEASSESISLSFSVLFPVFSSTFRLI